MKKIGSVHANRELTVTRHLNTMSFYNYKQSRHCMFLSLLRIEIVDVQIKIWWDKENTKLKHVALFMHFYIMEKI